MFSPYLGSAGDGAAAPRGAWLALGKLSSFSSAIRAPLERPWDRDVLCPPCPEHPADARDTLRWPPRIASPGDGDRDCRLLLQSSNSSDLTMA